jgi:hypothetical protein
MPLSDDMKDTKRNMEDQYGKDKGERIFYQWINKHGLDDTKSVKEQKGKLHAKIDNCSLCGDILDKLEQKAGNMVTDMVPPKASVKAELVVPKERSERNDFDKWFQQAIDDFKNKIVAEIKASGHLPYEDEDSKPEAKAKDVLPTEKDSVSVRAPEASVNASFKMPTLRFGTQFTADASGVLSTGEIPAKGVLVSQTDADNKNGWRIGKRGAEDEEFKSIANQIIAAAKAQKPIQVRLQHSDQPDKIIGGYYNAEPDIRDGYFGLNTTFFMNPKDPQVRYNIEKGLLRDMSIGLDANAFCDVCDKPLKQASSDGNQMWDYDCEHIGSPVYLRGCKIREGSLVSEPAFEGSEFKIGFAAALEKTLPRSLNRENANTNSIMSSVSVDAKRATAKGEGDGADSPFANADDMDKLLIKSKAYKALKAKVKAGFDAEGDGEGDAEGEGEGKDADASRAKAYSDPNLGRDYKQSNEAPRKDKAPDSKTIIEAKGEGEAEGEGDADAKAKAQASRKITSKTNTVPPVQGSSSVKLWNGQTLQDRFNAQTNSAAAFMAQEILEIGHKRKPVFRYHETSQ